MAITLKNCFSRIAHAASKDLQLPFILAFTIRVLSHLQIMFLVLSDKVFSAQKEEFNGIKSLFEFISGVRSVIMVPEIETQTTVTIVAYIFYIYIALQFIMIFYFIFQLHQGNKPRPWTSKLFAFVSFIHSHILFFLIHSFFLRLILSHLNCNDQADTLFYCQSQWLVLPCIFTVFNTGFAFLRELYCDQIRDQKDACALKDNLYPLILLTQKIVIVPLIYFLDNPQTIITILNILTCLLSLYLLQTRLPFYHLKILRLDIAFSSVNVLFSFFMLTELSTYEGDILMIMIVAIPLAIKLNLLYLDNILMRILKANKFMDPSQAIHFAILIRGYLKQITKSPSENKFGKPTFYISGLLKGQMQDIFNLEWNGVPQEAKTQAYLLVVSKLQALLKTHPHNKLLLLCLSRIYMKKLKDVSKSISLLNHLRADNLSIPMRNAAEDLYSQLEGFHSKVNKESTEKLSFMKYFEYREQTSKLKDLIKQEVSQQIKLWEMFNENCVHANKVISQAEAIDSLRSKIENRWNKELQNLEKVYVGAPLLYGLYLEVVQSLPYLGTPMMQRAYEQILKKNPMQKDIMDIFTGNSACILASSEPEKSGRIVDASSSVKQLFEIDKEQIIGSNIKVLLPKIMAERHDQLIQNFHKKFKHGMSSKLTSYARTLSDKYFSVELILHPLPSIDQGLNIIAYIRKLSNSVSIIIVDYDGKIIECSKDMQVSLSNGNRDGYAELEQICPDLVSVNQAFNIMYAPENQNNVPMLFEDDPYRQPNSPHNIKSEENPMLNASDVISAREFLVKPINNEETVRTDFLSEKGVPNQAQIQEMAISPLRKAIDYQNMMSREEAETICEIYKEKKILKLNMASSETYFELQIEPLLFAGSMYKVIRVNKPSGTQQRIILPTTPSCKTKPSNFQKESKDTTPVNFQKFNLNLKSGSAQGDLDEMDEFDELEEIEDDVVPLENQVAIDMSENEEEENNKQFVALKLHAVKSNSHKSKANSVIDSATSVRNRVSRLNNFFKNPKLSYATKVAGIMVYLSMLVVLISVCIDTIFTRQALGDVDDAVGLINFTNTRLFKLISAWRASLIVYSRSVAVRPNSASLILQYRGIVRNSTIDLLTNNNLLQVRVNDFRSEVITRMFFERQVSLWIPYENRITDNQKVDSFTASQIIAVNNMLIANWNGSIFDLKNRSEVLFALNNTVNDYLIAVSDSISDVNDFFEQTQTNNDNLLTAIIVLENLALIIPFISLRALFKIVFTGHQDLFKALSKIRQSNVEERIKQLNKITNYLKEDVEDSLLFYQDYISDESEHVKHENKLNKKNDVAYTRNYTLRGLVFNMVRYLIFTLVLVAIILTLFWLSFTSSIQGFNDLHRINTQLVTTYEYGGELSLILSSFYYLLIFLNKPEFKIRNDHPATQLKRSIDYLSRANDELISIMSLPGQGIEDPEIENLLKDNLCQYIPAGDDLKVCKNVTQLNSIGLLGINSKYYQSCALPILNFLNSPNLTVGISLLSNLNKMLGDMHVIVFDGYGSLADIVFSNFKDAVAKKTESNITYFQYIMIVIVVSMVLIRVVVIRKYQGLELAVFKILKLVPYEIIEKNKVITFYLSKKFSHNSGISKIN